MHFFLIGYFRNWGLVRIPLLLPFRVAKGNWVAEFVIRDVDRIFHSKGWELRGAYYTRVFKEALGSMPGCSLIHNVSDTRQRGRRGATRITATPSTGHPKIFFSIASILIPHKVQPVSGATRKEFLHVKGNPRPLLTCCASDIST